MIMNGDVLLWSSKISNDVNHKIIVNISVLYEKLDLALLFNSFVYKV
jgi:hypothetical protein